MGVGRIDTISARLQAHGLSPDTPAAVIENGSRPDERVFRAVLGNLAELARSAGIAAPALIIIGDVTALPGRESGSSELEHVWPLAANW